MIIYYNIDNYTNLIRKGEINMIFETEIIRKRNDESYIGDITFISTESLIDEAFNVYSNKMKAFIRNKKYDQIKHRRTFKLKTPIIARTYDPEGIPIMFDKVIDGYDSNGSEIYHFTWEVDPDVYDNLSKKEVNNYIGNKESEFIDKLLDSIGNEMIEYWKLDPKKDRRRFEELTRTYDGYRI